MEIKIIEDIYKKSPLTVRAYVVIRLLLLDFKRLVDFIPEGVSTIMEIGCGYGLASFLMANKFKTSRIRSYDLNSQRIEHLKSVNPCSNLEFISCDILKITNFEADSILMVDFLHHINYEDQKILLSTIYKSINKDSRIVIKDMNSKKFSVGQLFNYLIDIVQTKEFRFYYQSKESFIKLFESCGFAIENTESINKAWIPLDHIVFTLKKTYKQ